MIESRPLAVPPRETALGSLIAYITDATRKEFQPMNANHGLMPDLPGRVRGRQKKAAMGERALSAIDSWIAANQIEPAAASRASAAAG